MSAYDLSDKVVVITGGTGGIGKATARELLLRGARVAIADITENTPAIAADMSPSAFGVVADVRSRVSLDAAVERIVEHFGRIDVAIANAGILSTVGTLRTTDPVGVDRLFDVNINGVVNTVTAMMDQIVTHRGQVVLLSSVFAFMNGMGTIPYAMSKAAVEQLGRGLRIELARHGATATTVYFSLIDTPMIANGVDADSRVGDMMSVMPSPLLKRLRPDQAATAIVDGIAARAPRVTLPGRWRPLSALRGILGPTLDRMLVTDRRAQAAIAALDVMPAPTTTTVTTTKGSTHEH